MTHKKERESHMTKSCGDGYSRTCRNQSGGPSQHLQETRNERERVREREMVTGFSASSLFLQVLGPTYIPTPASPESS
jgi:hypothetical protein